MKKLSLLALLLVMCCTLCACGNDAPPAASSSNTALAQTEATEAPINVDLTAMSDTIVYSYVANVMNAPDGFLGQRFKVSGVCNENFWEASNSNYYYVLISDVTACCALGLEYMLPEGAKYPTPGSEIEITGVLETYEELGSTYVCLRVEKLKVLQSA